MNTAAPMAVVVLPMLAAGVLALVPSWRVGVWINAVAMTLLLLLAGALAWMLPHGFIPGAHFAVLTAFVAMTTSWRGWHDIAAALADRSMGRRRIRLHHVAFQLLIGAILVALLASNTVLLAWVALVIAVAAVAVCTGIVRRSSAPAAASRLVLLGGVGLVLALLGTLLLGSAPVLGGIFLLVGYGALAGLVPLQAWLADTAAAAPSIGVVLLANVPILVLARLHIAPGLLVAYGLIALLSGAVLAFIQPDERRRIAIAGAAQIGMVLVAFGIGGGATLVGWLHATMLTLLRAALLQAGDAAQPARLVALVGLAVLPLYALFMLAGPMVAAPPWLLLAAGVGAVLTGWSLVHRLPRVAAPDPLGSAPIWLQLAVAAVLALAMPAHVVDWFRALASSG